MIVTGLPGTNKSDVATGLAQHFDSCAVINVKEELERAMRQTPPSRMGSIAKRYVMSGDLVPDKVPFANLIIANTLPTLTLTLPHHCSLEPYLKGGFEHRDRSAEKGRGKWIELDSGGRNKVAFYSGSVGTDLF